MNWRVGMLVGVLAAGVLAPCGRAGVAAPRLKSPQALLIGVEDGFEGGDEREQFGRRAGGWVGGRGGGWANVLVNGWARG